MAKAGSGQTYPQGKLNKEIHFSQALVKEQLTGADPVSVEMPLFCAALWNSKQNICQDRLGTSIEKVEKDANESFYQDGLGTNIRKTQKNGVFI